jgi:phage gpG-like protein
MAEVLIQELSEARELGGIMVLIEQDFKKADYQKTMESFLPVLTDSHKSRFEQQVNPAGTPWKPLAQSTVRRKGHDKILFETGRLKASLSRRTSDSVREVSPRGQGLLFGTTVPYSSFHDDGRGVPRRQHVGMNEQQLQEFVDAIADHAVQEIKDTL